jgi:hypothetical protein
MTNGSGRRVRSQTDPTSLDSLVEEGTEKTTSIETMDGPR